MGSPVGSSIGDHRRNFRTRKIGVLRSFCGPRDFDDKVALGTRVSITRNGESAQKSRPPGAVHKVLVIPWLADQKCQEIP
ncbi:hypothetical protein CGZ80_04810 [Rhodopirellula sp. MGV]|nr:hypothetical protein CGZ80_04810 [Rhodopirellula sp. MGV]PNY34953.1 hypothetical protein C2E31_20855 [Rhodopirellula baltica]